ncbi:bifunctional folylpolyglutamate synthase/dihydrofolate synthase [Fodinicola feengrottensis]|uniref:bifunctional folylpolyglutamate synthase/dihydrofolate synthase n=1 Tax=Fodinicola feengrottensis TaxID=435914 RepID=UPI002442B260|nr:Mur ligase family protein [Fodinicola feengrottensis]
MNVNKRHRNNAGNTAKASEQLEEVLAALESRGQGRMVPDRSRIVELLDLLGNPQKAYPSVHLTGTNGKTSTARMIDSLLRAQGLRVGRYTSPHLDSPAERISVDGEPIDDERFVAAYQDVAPYVELMDARNDQPVTYFELMTAMAFAAFADTPVDVAVVEVGLGGTWDATNVLEAAVAVITPIGLDHVELLGPTIADIATEKAGIIHPGSTVVAAIQPVEAVEPLLRGSPRWAPTSPAKARNSASWSGRSRWGVRCCGCRVWPLGMRRCSCRCRGRTRRRTRRSR